MPNSSLVLDLDTVVSLMAQTMSALSRDQFEDAHHLHAARTYASTTPSLDAPPSSPYAAHGGLHRPVNPVFTATLVLKSTPSIATFAARSATSSDLLHFSASLRPKEPMFHGTPSQHDFLDPFRSHAVSGATQSVRPSPTKSICPSLTQSVHPVQSASGHYVPPSAHAFSSATQSVHPSLTQSVRPVQPTSGNYVQPSGHLWHLVPSHNSGPWLTDYLVAPLISHCHPTQ
jgi:hypothetical protein